MAEITLSSTPSSRRKLPVPRIDLTPMVDLGFLLITFFMYTTSLARPKVMELTMPYKPAPDEGTQWPMESTITLMPTKDHRVAWYPGTNADSLAWCGFQGATNVRNLLIQRIEAARHLPVTFSANAHRLHVVIEPARDCTYKDVVATLDEMHIADVPFYAITSMDNNEQAMLEKSFTEHYGK